MQIEPCTTQTAARRRGRPKDPQLEDRILAAAARLYGRHGWAGFCFEAIAREAGVGKSTLYGRWADAAELLSHLIAHRWQALQSIDTGSLDSDLRAFARFVLARFKETGGGIAWHLRRDIAAYPDLAKRLGDVVDRTGAMCLDILQRGALAGALRQDVDLMLMTQLLTSALETYAARHPDGSDADEMADHAYIDRILEILRLGTIPRTPVTTKETRS